MLDALPTIIEEDETLLKKRHSLELKSALNSIGIFYIIAVIQCLLVLKRH